jgi:hypothetical protein
MGELSGAVGEGCMLCSVQVRTLIMMLILVIPHGFNPAGDLTQRAPGSSLAGPSLRLLTCEYECEIVNVPRGSI